MKQEVRRPKSVKMRETKRKSTKLQCYRYQLKVCVCYRSPDKSTRSNNLSEIKEEDEQTDERVEVTIEPTAPGAASKETTPQVDGQAASLNHTSDTVAAAVSNKEDTPATSSTNEERTDSDTKNGSPAVEGDSIQRTDSSDPPPEDEGGSSVQRSRTDSGPPPSEGDTVTSFSSVKHLLS